MGRPSNKPFSSKELQLKRLELYEFYIKNNNFFIHCLPFCNSISFGKFSGEFIEDIVANNPEYIEHIIANYEDKCFDFREQIFNVSSHVTLQHIQLNQIKFEIYQFQKNTLWMQMDIPKLPEYYKYIC